MNPARVLFSAPGGGGFVGELGSGVERTDGARKVAAVDDASDKQTRAAVAGLSL